MTALGTLLKEIRQGQRYSQLDLAVEANISSRHISFLETGRQQSNGPESRPCVQYGSGTNEPAIGRSRLQPAVQ